jgi:hypothetical protein
VYLIYLVFLLRFLAGLLLAGGLEMLEAWLDVVKEGEGIRGGEGWELS